MRILGASIIIAVLWLVAGIAAMRAHTLPTWQKRVFKFGTLSLAMLSLAISVLFALATINNPFNDLTRGYATLFTGVVFGLGVAFLFLFGVMRERFNPDELSW